MAYREDSKKSVRNLSPIEAGFVRFFELMETSCKNVNSNYKNIEVQEPKPVQRNPRTPDRDLPNPFQGGF